MKDRQRRIVTWAAVTIYLIGLGFLGGVTVERIRFDRERNAVVARFDAAARQLRARMITVERAVSADRAGR